MKTKKFTTEEIYLNYEEIIKLKEEQIYLLENNIKDYRRKRDNETKRRNEIQDKLEDRIEKLEKENEDLKSSLNFYQTK